MAEKITRVFRRFTDEERQRLAKTRAEVMKEFPPKYAPRPVAAPGLGAQSGPLATPGVPAQVTSDESHVTSDK